MPLSQRFHGVLGIPAFCIILTTVFCLTINSSQLSAGIVVSDGTFDNSDWALTVVQKNNGGSATGAQINSGGNPGDARQVNHIINAGTPGVASTIAGLHLYDSVSINPSSTNLASVGFSLDYAVIFNGGGGNVGIGALVEQNGRFYGAGLAGYNGSSFNTVSDCYTESDFLEIDMTNTGSLFINGSNPDFSASGSAVKFGFITGNSNSPSNPGAYESISKFDNFAIDAKLSSVPEPGATGLLALGLALGFTNRRRRK